MNITENHIKLAARLYKCRDTMKKLFGDKWRVQIEFNTNLIKAAMEKHKLDALQASIKLIEQVKDTPGIGVFTMKTLAACVEIIEPTND